MLESTFVIIKETSEIWKKMKDIQNGLGIENISDLVLKEIYSIHKGKSLTKEPIKNIKWLKKKLLKNLII